MRLLYVGILLKCLVTSAVADDSVADFRQLAIDNPQVVIDELTATLEQTPNLSAQKKGQYHLLLCLAYNNLFIADKALQHASEAAALLKDHGPPADYQEARLKMAAALDLISRSDEAMPIAEEALEWAQDNRNIDLEIEALRVIGFSALSMAEHYRALETLQKAYVMLKRNPGSASIHYKQFASFLAQVHEYRHEPEESLPLFLEAADYNREQGNLLELSDALFGAGKAYGMLGDVENAMAVYQESLTISEQLNDEQGEAYTRVAMLRLQVEKGSLNKADYPAAINEVAKCRKTFEAVGNLHQTARTYELEARLYLLAGLFEQALVAVNEAILEGESLTQVQEKLDYLKLRARIQLATGDGKAAYHDMVEAYDLREQNNRKTEEELFQRMRAEFKLEQQEMENQLLNETNIRQRTEIELAETQKTITVLLVCILILAFGIMLGIYFNLQRKQARLTALASDDPLTGLSNRRVILTLLESKLTSTTDTVGVALLDLDNFKEVNDTYGHLMGDEVLKTLARIGSALLPRSCLMGRIGGEEFLIVFSGMSETACLNWLSAYSLKVSAEETRVENALPLPITFSAGFTSTKPEDTVPSVLARADDLMYQAKQNGKNRIESDVAPRPDQK